MNSPSMFLSGSEITELTQRQRPTAQSDALSYMGIDHKQRPDGTLVVLRRHVEIILGCNVKNITISNEPQPNWGAI